MYVKRIVKGSPLTWAEADGNIDQTISDLAAEVTARTAADAATLATARSYTDSSLVSVFNICGNFDASTGNFPTTGGTGTSGAINKGNAFVCNVAGTIGSQDFDIGDTIAAKVNTPGQTAANWVTMEHNTQQATVSQRGTAALSTSLQATTGTDDQTIMTPLKTAQQYADKKKNFVKSISVSRGTAYLNQIKVYFDAAASITSMPLFDVTNVLVKTTSGGTYAAPSYPIAIAASSVLYIQFDFSNTSDLTGCITIIGRDN